MTLKCSACGTDNRDGAAFCLGCGSRIEAATPPSDSSASVTDAIWASTAADATVQSRKCGQCGVANRASDNFCKACGAAIAPAGPATTAPAGPATTVLPVAAAPSSPTNRSKAPIIAFAVAACLVLAGAGFVLLTGTGGDDDAAPAAQDDDGAALDDEDRAEEESSTVPSSSVADEVDTTGSVATVPAQVVPTTTTQPPPQTTLASPPPATTAAPPPTTVPGDLGLAVPMTRPPCDDTYITLLASSLDPATDATAVGDALARYPGSAYLKTIETCPSLRPSVDGAEIYVVYLGPYLTESEACAARASGPSDAYVRILSLTVPDTHRIDC